MAAWFSGAFERCLELCDAVRRRDPKTQTHLALLKARALLRLDRTEEALRILREASTIPSGTDESITLRMLIGAARIRRGEVEDGLAILLRADDEAPANLFSTLRSELALNIALAHYARRRFTDAENALDRVRPDSDIVYARALEYRGWIASVQSNGARAATMFRDALQTLESCAHYDRFLEANCIRALAHLAVERLDAQLWSTVEKHRARIDWSADGLVQPRFWTAYCAAAFALEVAGNSVTAARESRLAERLAPNTGCRIEARCKRASIARSGGEWLSQHDHTESALELFEEISLSDLCGDETLAPLVLAEELAYLGRAEDARRALVVHARQQQTSAVLYISHTPATAGYRQFVEGLVADAADDRAAAIQHYREAFRIFVRIGYTRRAVLTAIRLVRATGDRKMTAYLTRMTSAVSPHSWIRAEVETAKSKRIRLTAVQREVLALICQGKSNPEIARLRKRSLHTVRNLVARLFEVFEVQSREQLAVECVRRGLYTPG
ncbi:MAG TPA: LuxR C-terminal-related transcriptional regulator [Candidatus Elarobacter sp.]|nr:LuxR C-terminal-related transcriptional regulator [Candidatus Elarobacter sp.]